MKLQSGLTLAEVLIALAVMGVAFGALAFTQVVNLRSSVVARTATETKAAANAVLERVMADVLRTQGTGTPDDPRYFAFNNYYWGCPDKIAAGDIPAGVRFLTSHEDFVSESMCQGDADPDDYDGLLDDVGVRFSIVGESGVLGEGVLTVAVTATHSRTDQTLTLGDRVTCYDVYPSPSTTAPEPCPKPTADGGGRP